MIHPGHPGLENCHSSFTHDTLSQ